MILLYDGIPQIFLPVKLRYGSARSVAGVHATPAAISSASEQGRACTLAAGNRCPQGTSRQHRGGPDMSVGERRWTMVVGSSYRTAAAEEVVL